MRFSSFTLKSIFSASLRAALLATGLAVTATAATAGGPDVAIRCDERGCSRIYCNSTGDRCFRVDDWRYGGRPYRFAGGLWDDPRYYGRPYDDEPYDGHRYRRYRDDHHKYDGPYEDRSHHKSRCESCEDDRPYYGF